MESPRCLGCGKRPAFIEEYRIEAAANDTTPDAFVRRHEGTLNKDTNRFWCTACYENAGRPPGKAVYPETPHPFGTVIYRITREMLLSDGTLVDISPFAEEVGIGFHVAITSTAWADVVEVPEGAEARDSERIRAHLMLRAFLGSVRNAKPNASTMLFPVRSQPAMGRPMTVTLKAIIGPGDEGEPVLTILLPHED